MIPADPLARLQKADPDTYHEWQWGLMPCSNTGVSINLNSALAEAWLQHCIQAAIRAREWTLQTVQRLCTAGTYIYWAKISTDMNGEKSLSSAYGDTEAEALALAYLEAIEAMKG